MTDLTRVLQSIDRLRLEIEESIAVLAPVPAEPMPPKGRVCPRCKTNLFHHPHDPACPDRLGPVVHVMSIDLAGRRADLALFDATTKALRAWNRTHRRRAA